MTFQAYDCIKIFLTSDLLEDAAAASLWSSAALYGGQASPTNSEASTFQNLLTQQVNISFNQENIAIMQFLFFTILISTHKLQQHDIRLAAALQQQALLQHGLVPPFNRVSA